MFDAIIIGIFVVAVAGVGYEAIDLLPSEVLVQVTNVEAVRLIIAAFGAIIGLALGLTAQTTYRRVEARVRRQPIEVILTRAVGLVLGLLLANLVLAPIFLLPIPKEFIFVKPTFAILASVMFSVLGISLADTHGRTFLRLINPDSIESLLVAEGTLKPASGKILDTSCIIDGRIEELLKTGFIEGQIIIPQFILQELQLLADAANDRKRTRGRRGLDILNQMQERYPNRIVVNSEDYEEINTVDAKLVRFTRELNGILVTNDYNLSKVANLQKVPILNINDLARSLRPIYLPGDALDIKIIRPGKEPQQGVGYLEDGTMVVVEDSNKYIGSAVRALVTSALQTSAGRMIFAKLDSSERDKEEQKVNGRRNLPTNS